MVKSQYLTMYSTAWSLYTHLQELAKTISHSSHYTKVTWLVGMMVEASTSLPTAVYSYGPLQTMSISPKCLLLPTFMYAEWLEGQV
jgi:hypothetical protein